MPTRYERSTFFAPEEIGYEKVACPRCSDPMEYKTDQPVFCNTCDWPDRWKETNTNNSELETNRA